MFVEEEEMVPESEEEEESSNIKMNTQSSDNNCIIKKKRGKYKQRDPLYYYYNIDGHTFKYTCKNKNRKNILDFRCSDTTCKAQAYYYRKRDEFTLNVFTSHKAYEDHTYAFNETYKKNLIQTLFVKKISKKITLKK